MPLFSVIIAVYNGASTLSKTLECLLTQTCRDFEVVIVNDESRDHSERVAFDFREKHPQIAIRYLHQKNKGLGGARNRAMREACGQLFAFLDQDDIWYPEKLKKTAQAFTNKPEISFVTHRLYRRLNGQIKEVVYCPPLSGNLFRKLLFDTNFFCGSAMSFRRGVLEKIGTFSENREAFHLSEDYDYWLRASAAGLLFHLIEEVLGEYVMHTGNFSNNKGMMFQKEWNVVWEHYRKRPVRKLSDPWLLGKRRGKILARQTLAFLGRQ